MKTLLRVLVLLAVGISASAQADAPTLKGRWIQGGMVQGQVAPGSQVWFNQTPLLVSEQGQFALGLAIDEPASASLRVRAPGQGEQRFEFAVEQRQYDVQRINGLPSAMVNPPASVMAQITRDIERVTSARDRKSPSTEYAQGFIWPVSARVSSVYGSRRVLNGEEKQPHFAVDLAAGKGTPIKASAAGTVSLARTDLYYTGGTVIIDHGQGISTTYLHMSRVDVKAGQEVKQGEVIGQVGSTGRATGPHLCWRANWYQTRLDPSLLIQDQPARKGEVKR